MQLTNDYDNAAHDVLNWRRLTTEQMIDIHAIDEGCPKRKFIDMIMNQLGDLVVNNPKNQRDVKLFEAYGVCVIPATNCQLKSDYGWQVRKKVKNFYRGIGRLFALCFLHRGEKGERNLLIAAKCLPSLYRNCKAKLVFLFTKQDVEDLLHTLLL